ncbi:MAG: lipoate--protein ligase family protein [Planctomycetota bacterium]
MALDQAILEATSTGSFEGRPTRPTLRFYGWSEPTLSLGYFQSHQTVSAAHASLCKVRRSTGGGAILHDHELTYSLTIPTGEPFRVSRQDLYLAMHEAIVTALGEFGISARPFRESGGVAGVDDAYLCFQRRTDEDLLISGYKVVGSAQRRARSALLQHGSILLRASESAPQIPGIFELTSQLLPIDRLSRRIADSIGAWLDVDWIGGEVDSEEKNRANELQIRFDSSGWWLRR